jgi:C1A family cysteine protease
MPAKKAAKKATKRATKSTAKKTTKSTTRKATTRPAARTPTHTRFGGFGWRPSMPDPRDVVADTSEIPILAEVDPRGDYMTPIYNQGQLGSCTANAVAAAIDADRIVSGMAAIKPSRLGIYWFERFLEHQPPAVDGGAMGRDGFKAARKFGVLPEKDWKYDDNASHAQFAADPRTSPKWAADYWVLEDKYKAVPRTLNDFKRVLSNKQTVAYGFAVFNGFVSPEVKNTGIVAPPQPDDIIPNEGHEVLAVGYLEAHPQHCLCRNSWGTSWGMDGYFLMPWSVLLDSQFSSDFRTIYRPLT